MKIGKAINHGSLFYHVYTDQFSGSVKTVQVNGIDFRDRACFPSCLVIECIDHSNVCECDNSVSPSHLIHTAQGRKQARKAICTKPLWYNLCLLFV